MGVQVVNYCDGCGDSVGGASLNDAVQLNAVGTDGLPRTFLLCVKPEYREPKNDEERLEMEYKPNVPKVTGCARKVLSKSVLSTLYKEVAEYTGDESLKPFAL